MSGELNEIPRLERIIGDLRRRIEELERRDAGTDQGLDLGDLNDVRVDALVDPTRTLSGGNALVWDATDKLWVPGSGGDSSVEFSYPGALEDDVESPPWYPSDDITFTEVRVSLLDNATASHVIELYVNGVLFDAYTLSSGTKTMTEAIVCPVLATEYLTVKTVTVSDDNMSVQLSL